MRFLLCEEAPAFTSPRFIHEFRSDIMVAGQTSLISSETTA
jgi:hypothetical protein